MNSFKINAGSIKTLLQWPIRAIFTVIQWVGLQRKHRPYSEFITFKQALRAAKAAGISVGEYIERKHCTGPKSALDQTLDALTSLGLFDMPLERICEIGPGSGRYLERFVACFPTSKYEIYETSKEWRTWLAKQYGVMVKTCDGRTLSQTESGSIDLIHAYKVFPGLPFLTSVSYFREMQRVLHDGGWVVFDIMTEKCFCREYLNSWFDVGWWEWGWSPHMIARDFVIGMFMEKGISFVGSFQVPLFPAITECMVFRKIPSMTSKFLSGGSCN